MKLVRLFYLLIAMVLIASSCSHTNEQLLRAEQLVETAPDSAMAILKKYSYNKLSDKDKALYGLVYIQVRDKKFLSLEPDSVLNFALDYYKTHNSENDRLGACYLYKGRQLRYVFQYEKAMNYYLMALEVTKNDLTLGRVNFDIGYILCSQKEFKKARDKFSHSYKYLMNAGAKSIAFNAALYIGRTYYINGDYKNALKHYDKLKLNVKDSVDKGILYQEIALNLYASALYDSALSYLKEVLYYPYVKNNKAIRYYMISDIYYDRNEVDSAIQYAGNALVYSPDIRTRKGCYRILTNSYSKKHDLPRVEEFMHKYQICSDSIQQIDSQTKGSYIETMHNTQKEVVKSRSWIWYLSLLFIIFAAGGIYLYIRKHKKSEKVIEQSKADYNREKAELRKDLLQKKRTELLTGIERIKLKQKNSDGIEKRVKDVYDELLHIHNLALFWCEMDKNFNNLITKLRIIAPDIKEKELLWCSLQLLEVPTHDILILLDYESINSLKRMKGRLAPRLSLQSASALNKYLLDLFLAD